MCSQNLENRQLTLLCTYQEVKNFLFWHVSLAHLLFNFHHIVILNAIFSETIGKVKWDEYPLRKGDTISVCSEEHSPPEPLAKRIVKVYFCIFHDFSSFKNFEYQRKRKRKVSFSKVKVWPNLMDSQWMGDLSSSLVLYIIDEFLKPECLAAKNPRASCWSHYALANIYCHRRYHLHMAGS